MGGRDDGLPVTHPPTETHFMNRITQWLGRFRQWRAGRKMAKRLSAAKMEPPVTGKEFIPIKNDHPKR
jgi:hypothetical protein